MAEGDIELVLVKSERERRKSVSQELRVIRIDEYEKDPGKKILKVFVCEEPGLILY